MAWTLFLNRGDFMPRKKVPTTKGRTGADLKAYRDWLGLGPSELAKLCGVSLDALKACERTDIKGGRRASMDTRRKVWGVVDSLVERHNQGVERLLGLVDDLEALKGRMPSVVHVAYCKRGEATGEGSDMPDGWYNAIARDAWQFLIADGVKVRFVYREDMHDGDVW